MLYALTPGNQSVAKRPTQGARSPYPLFIQNARDDITPRRHKYIRPSIHSHAISSISSIRLDSAYYYPREESMYNNSKTSRTHFQIDGPTIPPLCWPYRVVFLLLWSGEERRSYYYFLVLPESAWSCLFGSREQEGFSSPYHLASMWRFLATLSSTHDFRVKCSQS